MTVAKAVANATHRYRVTQANEHLRHLALVSPAPRAELWRTCCSKLVLSVTSQRSFLLRRSCRTDIDVVGSRWLWVLCSRLFPGIAAPAKPVSKKPAKHKCSCNDTTHDYASKNARRETFFLLRIGTARGRCRNRVACTAQGGSRAGHFELAK